MFEIYCLIFLHENRVYFFRTTKCIARHKGHIVKVMNKDHNTKVSEGQRHITKVRDKGHIIKVGQGPRSDYEDEELTLAQGLSCAFRFQLVHDEGITASFFAQLLHDNDVTKRSHGAPKIRLPTLWLIVVLS